jgi:nitroimidazol reductase NimA-like FMN-containing flavoprotein (pyridoxamine 5'-phosphate oxidase superfamily)
MIATLPPEAAEEVLESSAIGRIGVHADGRTYVVPVTYAYDGDAVYCHSVDGMKLDMLRTSPRGVCFEVEQVDDIANWRSVIAWGDFEELHGPDADAGLRLLVDRLAALVEQAAPHATVRPVRLTMESHAEAAGGPPPTVFRIRLTEKTARSEGAPSM